MANHPPRLEDFSYVGQYRYFLTICVNHGARVFTDDTAARFVITKFLQCAQAQSFEVLAYCAMPDHFHALVVGLTDTSDLKEFVRHYKQTTGHWWKHDQGHRACLWQTSFHDRILRDEDRNDGVIRYILMNPVRARIVEDPRDYEYLGAEKYDVQSLLEASCFWAPPWK
jgi:putative transposase